VHICSKTRFASSIVLFLGVSCFPSCSNAQGNKLDRPTALSVLRKAGGLNNEITAEAHTSTEWVEAWWNRDKSLEVARLRAQSELDFLNHLVDGGILRKKADTFLGCEPEPGCRDHNKYINFEVIASADVRVMYQGQTMMGRSTEFGYVVLARASNPKVTGITQEGIDATVEVEYSYSPTALYKRVLPLIKDSLAKCSLPDLSSNPLTYCGHWPTEAEISAKKETGSVRFRKYDDGWRIIKQ